MEDKWTCVSGFSYAGEHFTVWCKPMRNKDGSFSMETKAEDAGSYENMKFALNEQGVNYFST
jgi:hypothetical protein